MSTRVLACLLALVCAASAGAHEPDITTQSVLDLPEIFQISTLTGAMAVLLHVAAEPGRNADRACFARWPAHEDVLAHFVAYARSHPRTLSEPFAPTLVAALRDRCRRDP